MNKACFWAMVGCISIIVAVRTSQAVPVSLYASDFENSRPVVEVEDPEVALEILTRLGQSILRAKHEAASNSKRGLDLGLGRGFSGSQAAKHIMGLAAAKFSNGPGKRKRTELALDYPSSNPGMDVPPVSINSGNDW